MNTADKKNDKTTVYKMDANNKTVTATGDDLAKTGVDVAGVAAVSIVALMMGVGFIGVERSIRREED